MTTVHRLHELGQSIWLDYIRRSFIESGQLERRIEQGVRGVTSNPSIFQQAIAGSADYDDELAALAREGLDAEEVYERLAIADIRAAADRLRPVFDASDGVDGHVSLEVSPALARDTRASVDAAVRLHREVDRPNVMIKIPATREGLPAIEEALVAGVDVNVTLIFSIEQYEGVAEAYMRALERRLDDGRPVDALASVASVFVSRVDTLVDRALEERGIEDLQGRVAVANARRIYHRFRQLSSGGRWDRLEAAGARVQRVLWGSTSSKNPAYPDTLYVDTLVGPDTVNTVPPVTLDAVLDHGNVARTVDADPAEADRVVARLEEIGIDLSKVTDDLLEAGLKSFSDAFDGLLAAVEGRLEEL